MDPILLTRQQVRNISAFLENLPGAPEELMTLWSAITRNEPQGTPLLLAYSQTDATHDDPLPPSFLMMPLPNLAPPNPMMPLGLLPKYLLTYHRVPPSSQFQLMESFANRFQM
jgi:hypothetical protein